MFEASLSKLGAAVQLSYEMQLKEGMSALPDAPGCIGRKYAGGGWGGYALYLFENTEDRDAFVCSASNNRPIEPYITIR